MQLSNGVTTCDDHNPPIANLVAFSVIFIITQLHIFIFIFYCISSENSLKINAPTTTSGITTVTFAWSHASFRSDVSYSIKLGTLKTWPAINTGATVTDLNPGIRYNFSIVTSLPGDVDYPNITEQTQDIVWTSKFCSLTLEIFMSIMCM